MASCSYESRTCVRAYADAQQFNIVRTLPLPANAAKLRLCHDERHAPNLACGWHAVSSRWLHRARRNGCAATGVAARIVRQPHWRRRFGQRPGLSRKPAQRARPGLCRWHDRRGSVRPGAIRRLHGRGDAVPSRRRLHRLRWKLVHRDPRARRGLHGVLPKWRTRCLLPVLAAARPGTSNLVQLLRPRRRLRQRNLHRELQGPLPRRQRHRRGYLAPVL